MRGTDIAIVIKAARFAADKNRQQRRKDADASPAAFRADPALAWGFYSHRLGLYRETVPHAGFGMLRDVAASMPHGGFVFTSNVDVLMFNDWDWVEDRTRRQMARLREWLVRAQRPVVIEIGAGSAIATVRAFAQGLGAPIIRINPSEWQVTHLDDVGIPGGALEGIRGIASVLQANMIRETVCCNSGLNRWTSTPSHQ